MGDAPIAQVPVADTIAQVPIADKTGLTAKELALYVGVPVATLCVAGGFYYYYTKESKSTDTPDGNKIEPNKPENLDKAKASVFSQAEPKKEEPPDPLTLAQQCKGRGNKYFKAGRFEQAIECYSKAIELCPVANAAEISTFYQNRAAAQEQAKNWQEVVNDCTEAIRLNSKYTKALTRRARAYEELNQKRSCLEDVTAACILEGFQNQSSLILADRTLKSFGKELAADYFKKREHLLPSATFVKSYLDSFNKDVFALDSEEEVSENYKNILAFMKDKNFDPIIDLCAEEIEKDDLNKIHAHLLRGTLWTLMCYVEKAIVEFDKVLEAEDEKYNPLKVDALIKRGSLKMQLAQDVQCYEDFTLAESIDSQNPNIYHHRGQLFFLTERLDEARKQFEKSISLDDQFVAPRIQLGYCLCKLGMTSMQPSLVKDSTKMLEETTQLFPECPEAWSLFGQLLQDQQDLSRAAEMLEKAICLAPENPTTYVYKGLLTLQWKQDLVEATKLMRKAIELDDKCDFAYETLATLEVQKGNSEEAVRLFERALDLVRTEAEMASTFSLLEAAKAQTKVARELGITMPNAGMM